MIRFRYEHWLFRLPLLRRYRAICLGSTVYCRQTEAEVLADPRLVRHELTHQRQIRENGRVKFYAVYLRDYFRNLAKFRNHDRAYHEIPFEIEAREAEKS